MLRLDEYQLKVTFYTHYTRTTLNIQEYFTCNTSIIIYKITCSKCNKQYIEDTGRKLKTRVSEQFGNIEKNHNSVINKHFDNANQIKKVT